jgi:hypothetical protein
MSRYFRVFQFDQSVHATAFFDKTIQGVKVYLLGTSITHCGCTLFAKGAHSAQVVILKLFPL